MVKKILKRIIFVMGVGMTLAWHAVRWFVFNGNVCT